MQDISFADKDYRLWVLLNQTKDAIYKVRDKELSKLGISPIQAAVLFIVQSIRGPTTPAEISRWLFREPHSVSGILIRMEKEGLVRKVKDLEKKNLVRVVLTEKGHQAYSLSTKREAIHQIFSALSEEKRQQLTSRLQILLDNALGDLGMDRKLPFP